MRNFVVSVQCSVFGKLHFVLNTEHRTLKPTRAKAISQESILQPQGDD